MCDAAKRKKTEKSVKGTPKRFDQHASKKSAVNKCRKRKRKQLQKTEEKIKEKTIR